MIFIRNVQFIHQISQCLDSFIEQNNINLLLRFVPKLPFVMFPNRFWQKIDGQKWVALGVMTL